MDIGKDVLTKTIIGTTDAEKVFTPWWITLHHYLVYTLVVLGMDQYANDQSDAPFNDFVYLP